jgi:UPF0716 protein FxsA
MRLFKIIAIGLLAWPVAEIAAFIFVATFVGVPTALLLMILVSVAGLLILRHFGGAVTRSRASTGHAKIAAENLDGTGMAPGLGGILLVIPGFITGLLGVLTLFPISRRWLLAGCRRLFAANRQAAGSEIIDLAPNEWRPLPGPKLPPGQEGPNPTIEPTATAVTGTRRRSRTKEKYARSDPF